jgi:hypothetical protein
MARAYITDKQVGREFWYYAIKHAAHMSNQVSGRLGRKLTSPLNWYMDFNLMLPHGSSFSQ